MECCFRSGTQSALPLSAGALGRQPMILLTWTVLAQKAAAPLSINRNRADHEERLLDGRSGMT